MAEIIVNGVHSLGATLVDDDVFEWVCESAWWAHKSDTKIYVIREGWLRGARERAFLHRLIMRLEHGDSRRVDHINGDTFDNRRSNLIVVTNAGNAQNQGSRGGSSRYRGVTWDRARRKWMASAQLNGRKVTIGRFETEDQAGGAAAAWRAVHMPHSVEARAA